MFYCKTAKGYLHEQCLRFVSVENIEIANYFTDDIDTAAVFVKADLYECNWYVKKAIEQEGLFYEFIKIEIPKDLKILCIRDHLGDVQDKTKLDPFGRKFLTMFKEEVEWVEKTVRMHLWETDFVNNFYRRTRTSYNPSYEKKGDRFLEYFYIGIYAEQGVTKDA